MAFQTPITIAQALQQIDRDNYLLPAIQREVVWSPEQIARLFDSLMQGYPFGSFLFWKVSAEQSQSYGFYEFMREYHEKNNRHLRKHSVPNPRELTGVLDGQQRLTAFNIGLRGRYAKRLPRTWAALDSNYPWMYLYLRLDGPAEDNELGMLHDFRFLTAEQAAHRNAAAGTQQDDALIPPVEDPDAPTEHWFKVSDIWNMDPDEEIYDYIHENVADSARRHASKTLRRLNRLVHEQAVISYFLEGDQDLDKVLNIFIRVNSGGTVLSYSDLLLSIATAQWTKVDAREVIHSLVDELNGTGLGFNFDKDLILKSGLMLTDTPSIGFRVTNFNAVNMTKLQDAWDDLADALRLAVRLFASLGYSQRTLSATSSLIPIAYYLHRIEAEENFLTHHSHAENRERIRGWLARSLLKQGVWGSGLDSLLIDLRSVLRSNDSDAFPVEALEAAMARRGKTLRFDDEELERLVTLPISDRRTFVFLSVLFPGFDVRNEFHIDHVFPASGFSRRRLLDAGVPESDVQQHVDASNSLPNLQLLEGPINQSKQDKAPSVWMRDHFRSDEERDAYCARHLLGNIPEDTVDFLEFYNDRRARILRRAEEVLGVLGGRSATTAESDPVVPPLFDDEREYTLSTD